METHKFDPDDVAITHPNDLGVPSPLTLDGVADALYARAEHIMQTEGEVSPAVFLFSDESVFIINAARFFTTYAGQDDLAIRIRNMVYELPEIVGVALAAEGWRIPKTSEAVVESELEHREDKELTINLQCEWFDGTQKFLVGTVDRVDVQGISEITIRKPITSNHYEGRFSTLFPPSRQGGLLN